MKSQLPTFYKRNAGVGFTSKNEYLSSKELYGLLEVGA
jgi:hypothetical protein